MHIYSQYFLNFSHFLALFSPSTEPEVISSAPKPPLAGSPRACTADLILKKEILPFLNKIQTKLLQSRIKPIETYMYTVKFRLRLIDLKPEFNRILISDFIFLLHTDDVESLKEKETSSV